ncbi:hypothetical protein [Mycolicibacterium septicum]|uniref:hypothetical protein n=1 Tax=Mycolicibacterium septicum TaxID=98668 RepID=UPI001AF7D9EF|nr:hypothetical protein [Mycolicibacterium septicum]QRY51814.1 hypothetical protein JVX95_31320 [Mycolicibacterium septicum]
MADDFIDFLFAIVVPGLVALVVIGGLATGIMKLVVEPVDRSSCAAFAEASGRETKFVEYNFFEWDCLTPQSDGKWISTSMLREV